MAQHITLDDQFSNFAFIRPKLRFHRLIQHNVAATSITAVTATSMTASAFGVGILIISAVASITGVVAVINDAKG
jgi:ABC-type multidrug transport system permease subunit